MKKVLITAVLLLGLMPTTQAMAADFELEVVFEDTLYGAAIGALVGVGAMLISGAPKDNLDYITTGTGLGIIAGAAYGVASTSGALASYEDGKLHVAMAFPQVKVQENANGSELAMHLNVFNSRF